MFWLLTQKKTLFIRMAFYYIAKRCEAKRKHIPIFYRAERKPLKKIIGPLIIVAALSYLAIQKKKSTTEAPINKLPQMGTISSFSLLDQFGGNFGSEELQGKVWVASFMFTRCQGPCPMMSQKMAKLQSAFKDMEDIVQISISMDPEYDKSEVLQSYASKYHADGNRWKFLTGPKKSIISLAIEAFKLPAGEDPDVHSTRFVLVDSKGVIRGYYDSLDPKSLEQLKTDAIRLNQDLGSAPTV